MRAPNKANPKEAPKMTTQDGWFPRGFDIVKMPLATNAQMAFVKTTMCLYCAKIPAEVSERPVAEECERPVAEECELILELGLNSISIWGCLFSDTSFRIEHLTHNHTHTLIYTQTYKCIYIYIYVYIYIYI